MLERLWTILRCWRGLIGAQCLKNLEGLRAIPESCRNLRMRRFCASVSWAETTTNANVGRLTGRCERKQTNNRNSEDFNSGKQTKTSRCWGERGSTRASFSKGGHSRVARKGSGPDGSSYGVELPPKRTFDTAVLGGKCAMCLQKSRYGACVCGACGGAYDRRAMTTMEDTCKTFGASS